MSAGATTTVELPLPIPGASLALDAIWTDDPALVLGLRTTRRDAPCPRCGQVSARVQSRYRRTLADLAAFGVPVRLELRVRRFACHPADCTCAIFAERLPDLAAPYARRTARLTRVLMQVGLGLGGAAGARLLPVLGLTASADTVLRVVHRAAVPPSPTPRVLGVDDWAKRRGHDYGAILVDLERHRPVELLDDRTAATLAAWLVAHPGVEIVTRDRAGAFAEGVRVGAPGAEQVADRWHLLKNVGDLLERLLHQHHAALTDATAQTAAGVASASVDEAPAGPPAAARAVLADTSARAVLADTSARQDTPAQTTSGDTPGSVARAAAPATDVSTSRQATDRAARRARREAVYVRVRALHAEGRSIRTISTRLDLSRTTVRKYLHADRYPGIAARRTLLGPLSVWDTHLRERWQQGCTNARVLWRELCERGFQGSAQAVRHPVAPWRAASAGTPAASAFVSRRPAPPRPRPSAHQVRWWLLRPEAELTPAQQVFVRHLVATCPAVATGQRLALAFGHLVRARDVAALAPWLDAAAASGLATFQEFTRVLRYDLAAVQAALTSPWSNGQTEGQVTKIKLLKRQGYGRASLHLLRQRLLGAA